MPKFTVSQHVAEATLKKAMSLCLFLRLMYERDDCTSTHVPAQTFAKDLAEKAGKLVGVSASFVYRAYKEWREGQEELAIRAKEKGGKLDSNKGCFCRIDADSTRGDFCCTRKTSKLNLKGG